MRFRTFVLWALIVGLGLSNLANAQSFPAAEQKDSTVSPQKAFLLSLLVPGSGQLYVGKKRGIVFAALEAVMWPAYFAWRNKGKDIEKAYQVFADLHWESDPYDVWQVYIKTTADSTKLSHNYEEASRQQQYEMIGKYDQFVFGWDDSEPLLSSENQDQVLRDYPPDSLKNVTSSNRSEYVDMRYDSNRYLKRTSWCAGALLANHILSAIDAARCAQLKRSGLSLENRVKIGVALKFEPEETIPILCFSKRF